MYSQIIGASTNVSYFTLFAKLLPFILQIFFLRVRFNLYSGL